MAERETGVVRQRAGGDLDKAKAYSGIARTQLGILKNLMSFQDLKQLSRTVYLGDGTRVVVSSVFGQDTIRIDTPEIVGAGGEEVAVEEKKYRVADYVGVAMPNPVPYRGVSIGVVDRGNLLGYPATISPVLNNTTDPWGYITKSGYFTRTGPSSDPTNDYRNPSTFGAWEYGYLDSLGVKTVVGTGNCTYTNRVWTPLFVSSAAAYYLNPASYYYFNIYGYGAGLNSTNSDNTFQQIIDSNTAALATAQTNADAANAANRAAVDAENARRAEAGTGGVRTYVMASDGTVLASEVQNTIGTVDVRYRSYAEWSSQIAPWNGGSNIWMFSTPTSTTYDWHFDHKLVFLVPEDCIYPAPTATTQVYPYSTSTPPYGEVPADWNTDWQAGVTAFKLRRKAWFLKNTTELMAALKGGFAPGTTGVTRAELQTGKIPASWDYAIKTHCRTSYKTYRPILMNASYVDVVTSDTSANLTQAGTKVTKRTVTFNYVDAAGVFQQKVIDGYLTTAVIIRTSFGQNPVASIDTWAYLNWYDPNESVLATYAIPREKIVHQFLLDRDSHGNGVGLLWSGIVVNGIYYDSTWANSMSVGALYNAQNQYSPPYPPNAPTLVGTAPDFVLNYHNTVLPNYHSETPSSTHDGDTAWNNSALYNVKQVELLLFGPAPGGVAIGIFPDPTDAHGATKIAYYGEATLSFDWSTGLITPMGTAIRDTPTIIDMPAGYSYYNQNGTLYFRKGTTNSPSYNCAIGYVWDGGSAAWPDVDEYLRAKIAAMRAGGGDQILYTIIKQALAL